MQTFSEKLTLLMNSKGLTQSDLAQKLNIGQTTISQWQRGVAKPNPRMLQKISDFFCVQSELLKDNTQRLFVKEDENAISANMQIQNITHSLDKIITLRDDLNTTINEVVSLLKKQIENIKNF